MRRFPIVLMGVIACLLVAVPAAAQDPYGDVGDDLIEPEPDDSVVPPDEEPAPAPGEQPAPPEGEVLPIILFPDVPEGDAAPPEGEVLPDVLSPDDGAPQGDVADRVTAPDSGVAPNNLASAGRQMAGGQARPAQVTAADQLPRTGFTVGALVLALTLVMAGGGMLMLARRRARTA